MTEQTTPAEVDDEELPAHVVRLVMTVRAESESEAVLLFVEELMSRGIRNWVFATLDPDSGQPTGEFNGYGEDVTAEVRSIQQELLDDGLRAALEGEEPPTTTAELPAPTSPESDTELLALATQLNDGE